MLRSKSRCAGLLKLSKGSGMGKRVTAILFIAVLFAVSTGYDFYRGYHGTRSIIGGIVSTIFGLVILGFLWSLYSGRRNSK
jgi:hypothetical protein